MLVRKVYPTIYTKAACIMEAFCREHIFADGNKRTAVLAMFTFLTINNHNIALPFSTVKYTVKIAQQVEQRPEDIDALITDISEWIEARSSTNIKGHRKKMIRYVILPWIALLLLQLSMVGIPIHYLILRDWFQTKTHPEYKYRLWFALKFIIVVPAKLKQITRQQ